MVISSLSLPIFPFWVLDSHFLLGTGYISFRFACFSFFPRWGTPRSSPASNVLSALRLYRPKEEEMRKRAKEGTSTPHSRFWQWPAVSREKKTKREIEGKEMKEKRWRNWQQVKEIPSTGATDIEMRNSYSRCRALYMAQGKKKVLSKDNAGSCSALWKQAEHPRTLSEVKSCLGG